MEAIESSVNESREKIVGKLRALHAGEESVYTGCVINCGAGQCVLKVRRKNGKITAIEPDDHYFPGVAREDSVATETDIIKNRFQLRGCPMAWVFHKLAYAPDRILHPLKRVEGSRRMEGRYERVSWDEAARYAAMGLMAIARTYSGDAGRERFGKDGYAEEMLHHWHGAGTRTLKIGSSLPVHGVIGKFGLFRFANMMALIDHHVRGVPPEQAQGAREWSEYTWRGDQAPGQPFVHGLQTSDCDFNDIRHTRLHIQVGKNLIENKMPESHWMTEVIERGGKIVNIAPEYNCPATKANYFIPVRPGLSDTAIFLYLAKYLIDEKLYDADFVRRFTDLPLLLRTDTLKRLKPEEVFPNYQMPSLADGPSYKIQGLTDEQRKRVGDFVVYDEKTRGPVSITRDEVGDRLTAVVNSAFRRLWRAFCSSASPTGTTQSVGGAMIFVCAIAW